jgi:hypothetical protein
MRGDSVKQMVSSAQTTQLINAAFGHRAENVDHLIPLVRAAVSLFPSAKLQIKSRETTTQHLCFVLQKLQIKTKRQDNTV